MTVDYDRRWTHSNKQFSFAQCAVKEKANILEISGMRFGTSGVSFASSKVDQTDLENIMLVDYDQFGKLLSSLTAHVSLLHERLMKKQIRSEKNCWLKFETSGLVLQVNRTNLPRKPFDDWV